MVTGGYTLVILSYSYTIQSIQYLGLSNATSKATGSGILRQGSSNVPEVAATVVTVAEGPKVGAWGGGGRISQS